MRFVVSSTELLSHLQAVSKVISSKSTLPILDNFLFNLEGNELTITASDLESTLVSRFEIEDVEGEGSIAIEAKRLLDILKEFPEQPLTFEVDLETLSVDILTENGKFSVVGQESEDFPQPAEIKPEEAFAVKMPGEVFVTGINKTIFATADDELRPVMNGIFVQMFTDNITFVASDSHKLVRYRRTDVKADGEASFILPKKPANLLKAILPKDDNEITVEFDTQNVIFRFGGTTLISRLTEGEYPNYSSVIPTESPNKMIIDRIDLYNTVKRVSVFSNQASNLVKLELNGNQLTVSAQDIDFSISAYEHLNCQYEGENMNIGFKSTFINEILTALNSVEVVVEMSDGERAALFLPFDKVNEDEDELMLLMPLLI